MTGTSSPSDRTFRLGLIGGNITATRSPALHIVCGLSLGRNVTYDLIVPDERGMGLADLLAHCAEAGFDGVNVTYPHKEEAMGLVPPGDPVAAAMGASNTVKFTASGPRAFNTDHTGFVAAYRARFGTQLPGRVLVVGAGGAGRAVAFALSDLGASEIILSDTDPGKVTDLAAALATHAPVPVTVAESKALRDLSGIDGIANCTPLGMVGRPGSPLPEGARGTPIWGFDAVYTPAQTPFRAQVEAMGAAFLPGYELYFQQGVAAFEIFTGLTVADPQWVRKTIAHRPDRP